MLYLRAFSECERILDVHAKVPNGALDFRVAEQDLHGAQVARLLVDDRGLGSSQRMRPISSGRNPIPVTHFSTSRAYCRVLI